MIIEGFYGFGYPCQIVYIEREGEYCYAVKGDVHVFLTAEKPLNGVDIDYIEDRDYFTVNSPIENEDDLWSSVDDYLHAEYLANTTEDF